MAPVPRDRDKLSRMEQAVRVLLQGLGEDLDREGLRDTPKRVAKALLDCTQGYHQDTASTLGTALFHEPIVHQGGEGIVVVRDIDFASTSEETLLPFHGRCHVAYRPKDGVVLGLSKLARLTKQYAKRLQTQERLAAAIALALQQSLECHGVAVVLQARHLANNSPPDERTSACVSGVFAAKESAELQELLALLDLEDLPHAAVTNLHSGAYSALATHIASSTSSSSAATAASADSGVPAPGTPDPSEKDTDGDSDDLLLDPAPSCCEVEEMEAAMQQLLLEIGENPHRPGLAGSARRYVMSLLASTSGYHMHSPSSMANRPGEHPAQLPQPQSHQTQHQQAGLRGQGTEVSSATRGSAGAGGCHGQGASGKSAAPTGCAISDVVVGRRSCGGDVTKHGGDCDCDCGVGTRAAGAVCGTPMAVCWSSPCDGGFAHNSNDNARTCAGGSAATEGAAAVAKRSSQTGCCSPARVCHRPHRGHAAVQAGPPVGTAAEAVAGPLCGAVTVCLPFASQCEHHMLPFYGNLMVAYLPQAAAVSRAAVEQVVLMYTQRLQVQERITHQVADAVEQLMQVAVPGASVTAPPQEKRDGGADAGLQPARVRGAEEPGSPVAAAAAAAKASQGEVAPGVMVVCDAAHMCMVARGVENHSGSTTTFAVRGAFAARPELRRAVLRLFRQQ